MHSSQCDVLQASHVMNEALVSWLPLCHVASRQTRPLLQGLQAWIELSYGGVHALLQCEPLLHCSDQTTTQPLTLFLFQLLKYLSTPLLHVCPTGNGRLAATLQRKVKVVGGAASCGSSC